MTAARRPSIYAEIRVEVRGDSSSICYSVLHCALLGRVVHFCSWKVGSGRRTARRELDARRAHFYLRPTQYPCRGDVPAHGRSFQPVHSIQPCLAYVAIALSVAAILGAVRTPSRKATGLLVSVVLFYAALFMSSIGGIIPAFPEVY